ncbi:valine--tRNA ligase [Candidatus Kaiserbacteria bacterium]|nr:valine--tRNA ligase [Candidatus Kaiserbacteria bacterium]
MDEKFTKPYDPRATEARIYTEWEKSGHFAPKKDGEPFAMMMPPPNATGVLHIGHALGLTLEDILIRYKRMRGYAALWLPGTDHAAIATQAKVEKEINKKEGKHRHDLGREELLKRIGVFVKESRAIIEKQIRVLGASCDWSREAFTLDAARRSAVNTLFKRMSEAGLIYRGSRIINWDPRGQTTISDDEIVHEERPGKLYTLRYAKDFPIAIATTRPETKVGDVAVAVHPEDARYREFVGKEYDAVFCDVPIHIKIVADAAVDPAFGTGAVGVTPAHSYTDWEIADRHQLSHEVVVINELAKMAVSGRLKEKKTNEAREIVVEWLKAEGLLEKEEETLQNIATAERTGGVIEPLPKLQWFVDVNKEVPGRGKSLKQLMLEPVRSGQIRIIPEHFEKTYFHWLENLRDWCISRQIWYGQQVPVWYKGEEAVVGEEPASEGWVQDEDTLDTWFSSGAWTFSTLGWPEATEDLKKFHPTDVLETGYDILFFWVARMILMSEFALAEIPFRTVYLHGIIRDAEGRKISKSLGNNIDPVETVGKFGADALRMALVVGNTPGMDSRIDEEKIRGYSRFANKLWNIARFILEQSAQVGIRIRESAPGRSAESYYPSPTFPPELAGTREWKGLEVLTKDVTKDLDEFRMYVAAEKIYHYVWHELADKILEESKPILNAADQAARQSRAALLRALLGRALKLLHPFMPFITEEIYQSLPAKDAEFLMIANWPVI